MDQCCTSPHKLKGFSQLPWFGQGSAESTGSNGWLNAARQLYKSRPGRQRAAGCAFASANAMPAAAKARKVHPQRMLAGLSCFAEQQTHGIHFRDAEHSCDTLHSHLYSGCRLADDAHKSAHHKALTRRGEEENQGWCWNDTGIYWTWKTIMLVPATQKMIPSWLAVMPYTSWRRRWRAAKKPLQLCRP